MGSRIGPQGPAACFTLGFLLMSGVFAGGCVNKDGEPLPPGLMTFPIAIELSNNDPTVQSDYAFVVNSNFALQFDTGTVQSYDLNVMNAAIDSTGAFVGIGCAGAGFLNVCLQRAVTNGIRDDCIPEDGETKNCECDPDTEPECVACSCDPETTTDLQCDPVPADRCSVIPEQLAVRDQGALLNTVVAPGLLVSEAQIGSFADGLALSSNAARLYVPVRSDANLTYIDVNAQGQFNCGSGFDVERQACTPRYRTGDLVQADPDFPIPLPPDPVDVFAGSLSDFLDDVGPFVNYGYILMAHREGAASLFFDPNPGAEDDAPELAAIIEDLAIEQVTVTVEPDADKAWISSGLSNQVVRVGVSIGIDESPEADILFGSLFNAGTLFVTGLDRGDVMRDIQFDTRENAPDSGLAYLLSRSPESLVVARRDVAGQQLNVLDQISICRGPSRLKLVEIQTNTRGPVLTAWVSCFNQRQVEIVDLELFQPITVLTNISGSFEFSVDLVRNRLYVADFSISVIRVADITPLIDCLDAQVGGGGGAGGGGGTGGTGGGATDPTPECSPFLVGLVGVPQPVSEFPR